MIIQGNRVFIAGQFMPAQIKENAGKIVAVLPHGAEIPDVDYGDKSIVPGFIDLHTHGMGGYSADEPSPQGLIKWLTALPSEGVTSFLPTTTTQNKEDTIAALQNISAVKNNKPHGAEIIGVHLEGPFLDSTFRGMHKTEFLKSPAVVEFQEYQQASGGNIRYVTTACEHDKDFALIQYASSNHVTVSIGHTGATLEGALLAVANGA